MRQATLKKPVRVEYNIALLKGLRESALVVLVAFGAYFMVALLSYDPADPGWTHSGSNHVVNNLGGKAGAYFADLFLLLFGFLAYLAPLMVAYSGWLLFQGKLEDGDIDYRTLGIRWAGFLLTLCAGCGLATLHFNSWFLPSFAGGILGHLTGSSFVAVFSFVGATLLLMSLFFAGITIFSSFSWLWLVDLTGKYTLLLSSIFWKQLCELKEKYLAKQAKIERQEVIKETKVKFKNRLAPRIEPIIKEICPSERVERERQIPLFNAATSTDLPPVSILDKVIDTSKGYSNDTLEAMSRQLELKLLDFNIDAEVVEVHPGPVITRFEVQLAAGIKVSKVSNLAKDLARALSVISVRVVEVIPGKSYIGIEIPNEHRELVVLSDVLQSAIYDEARSPLTLGLGKDINGRPVVADLAKMPHLLVAGTTGAGKSVALNAMLLSLLYKANPQQVRMILIDPKMLELAVYEGVPHLLTPVVTDMKEAANALRWCVAEMERRYKLMSALGVRNIYGYNTKVQHAIDEGEPLLDPLANTELIEGLEASKPEELASLPNIVIIVDEFADMMMVVGKKVEELIARIAQKARAAGIHLILATQRPSVDVITGLIKANIPSRIAFQVSSKVDSRTILDQMGAEQLLGHGDMLYLPPGTSIPERIHGAFVSDDEVHKVVAFLKQKGEPAYLKEVTQDHANGKDAIPGLEPLDNRNENDLDPLYDEAVAIVTETRKASISYLQRRLKVGYNRAARMIEEMENSGVVSAVQSNGSREVIAPPPVGK